MKKYDIWGIVMTLIMLLGMVSILLFYVIYIL